MTANAGVDEVSTDLCEIMGRHGSDKGHRDIMSSWHNYTQYYHKLFADMRMTSLRVFELGLGTNNPNIKSNMGIHGTPGASLRGWNEYFPFSQVFGADIDQDILFSEDGIQTYWCDQTDPISILRMWESECLQEPFDIIVDDGLHEIHANVCFFELSFYKVKKNGYYIIEDVLGSRLTYWNQKLTEWRERFPMFEYEVVTIPSLRNDIDNNLIVARRTS